MLVRQYVTDALTEIGYQGADDPLDGSDGDLGLRLLIAMVDQAQIDRWQLFTVTRTPYVLTANQQTRTIGSGGNFNGTRPLWVPTMTVVPVGDTSDIEVVPYKSRDEWLLEPNKTLTLEWPLRFLYELGAVLGTFTFWPIPTTAATVYVATPVPLTTPVTLDTDLVLPPGYQEFFRLALAKRCCRPFGQPVSQDLMEDWRTAKGLVSRLNDRGPDVMTNDICVSSRFDILTGRHR